ncbi:MAG: flagellar biosynthetic protein FliR [Myxococcaceae bacterium]|nr:flagellar biosynthetic protein FliR [Myxococcaceae bacterium]
MQLTDAIQQVKEGLGLKYDFTIVMMGFALLLARLLPTFVLTPMVGGDTTPTEVKLGLGVIIGMVCFPVIEPSLRQIPTGPVTFMAILLKEIFIGFTISFIVSIVFDAAQVAGQLVDNMSGTNQAQIMVPSIQTSVSLYASLKLQLFITLFLTLNGHHIVIDALASSFRSIPLEAFPRFSNGFWPFFDVVIRVFADMMRISLALAAPVLLATFLTDLALGMINRVAPQVQVFFVAMQIKPAVTVLIVFTSMHLIMTRVTREYGVMFEWMRRALQLMG